MVVLVRVGVWIVLGMLLDVLRTESCFFPFLCAVSRRIPRKIALFGTVFTR